MMACSRAPDPRTRILTRTAYPACADAQSGHPARPRSLRGPPALPALRALPSLSRGTRDVEE
ncbi:hypothetical protein GCM10009792_24500 [Microcella alkalica]